MRAVVRDEQRSDGPKAARPFGVGAQMWSVLGLGFKMRGVIPSRRLMSSLCGPVDVRVCFEIRERANFGVREAAENPTQGSQIPWQLLTALRIPTDGLFSDRNYTDLGRAIAQTMSSKRARVGHEFSGKLRT